MEPCRSTAVYLLRGLLVGLTALSQGARGLELRACFGDWLVLEDGESWRTSVLQHSWGVHAAAAHVNRRDCSIIKSCEQALRIGDDEYITISLKV